MSSGERVLVVETVVVIERDPVVAKDMSMTLGRQFPHAVCQVHSSLAHARPANPNSDAQSLYVICFSLKDHEEDVKQAFADTKNIGVVLVDPPSKKAFGWPPKWAVLHKPFFHEQLLKATEVALEGLGEGDSIEA